MKVLKLLTLILASILISLPSSATDLLERNITIIDSNLNLVSLEKENKLTNNYQPWAVDQNIILEFSQLIYQGDFIKLHFKPTQIAPPFADTQHNALLTFSLPFESPNLKWSNQQTLTIAAKEFYRPPQFYNGINYSAINLPFDTTYQIYIEFNNFETNEPIYRTVALFKTPPINLFATYDFNKKLIDSELQNSLNATEKSHLSISQLEHQKDSAQERLRKFTGKGVKIAIQDDGISQTSKANSQVVFRLQELSDSLLGRGGSHGTLMANFLSDYAPFAELYDFNVFPYVQHINKRIINKFQSQNIPVNGFAQLANKLNVDLMNMSLVSSKLGNRVNDWITATQNGLVISKSLGNNPQITHKIDQLLCTDPANFMPYFAEQLGDSLIYGSGAIITLQAVIKENDNYYSIRSQAGDAAPYTLSILETITGATSQAAATFSGAFALIKEASIRYNRNYTAKQLTEILIETATDIGELGVDSIFGHGLINMDLALKEIEKGYAPTYKLYTQLNDFNEPKLLQLYNDGC